VREAGLNALELQFVRNVQFNAERAEEARLEASRSDVLLSVHAPYYINFSSPSEETRGKSEEWVLKAMRGAEAFGAWMVVVHAATYGKKGSERTTEDVISSLRKVKVVAEDEGLRAIIGLETMGKKAVWGTLEEIGKVMEAVEGVLPVVDFAHLQARGPEITIDSLNKMLEGLSPLPRLHCHLSGIEYTGAGERKHLRLGEGLDHRMVLDALRSSGAQATVICESTSPLEDAQIIRRYLDEGC